VYNNPTYFCEIYNERSLFTIFFLTGWFLLKKKNTKNNNADLNKSVAVRWLKEQTNIWFIVLIIPNKPQVLQAKELGNNFR